MSHHHPVSRNDKYAYLLQTARQLLQKIQAEEAHGTPIHAHPDHPWRLTDGGYPHQYAALHDAVKQFD